MNRTISTLPLILLLCAASVGAQQVTKRVRFPRGRTTAVLPGRTNASSGVVYVFGARAGQHLLVHLTSPKKDVKCQIHPVNAELLPGALDVTDWEGDLPQTGDYAIIVVTNRGTDSYTLELTIR